MSVCIYSYARRFFRISPRLSNPRLDGDHYAAVPSGHLLPVTPAVPNSLAAETVVTAAAAAGGLTATTADRRTAYVHLLNA